MSLLFHKRTLEEVLGMNTRMPPAPVNLGLLPGFMEAPLLGGTEVPPAYQLDRDQTGCRCDNCAAGKGAHWVLHADDGVTFEHSCAKMSGGRVGVPDHFGNGQVQCPICNQSA